MSTPGLPTTNEEAWAVAGAWSPEREMSAFEALMWRMETDAHLRSTMTVVDVLDRPPDDRLLIINCDDLGSSYAANVACYEALRTGLGTSATLMVPVTGCPAATVTMLESA